MTRRLGNPPLDANFVAPRLLVGSKPPPGRYRWINVITLCAKEYQPPTHAYPGVTVLRVPLVDDPIHPMSDADVARVLSTAGTVARYLETGACVLVTCQMGINRSSLVAAIAMQLAFDMGAEEAIHQIRGQRSAWALSNPRFEKLVYKFERTR